ncbi:MAG: class I SAM-dependent methyltransferase [Pseudomonadota bacterium]
MAIHRQLSELIFREQHHLPLDGDVITIGRLCVELLPQDAKDLARSCGLSVTEEELELEERIIRGANGKRISDKAFFHLLNVEHLSSLDVSEYEGANHIHDLNILIPNELEEKFDFIVDGGTSDNVFDPAMTLRNLSKMLKPGGRVVATNMASNHQTPYVIFNAIWFLDYFVVNKFNDCKVYICIFRDLHHWNVFTYDLEYLASSPSRLLNIETPYRTLALMLAEKSHESSWDEIPTQWQYRSDGERSIYSGKIRKFLSSKRPPLLRSNCERFVDDVPDGYLYVEME